MCKRSAGLNLTDGFWSHLTATAVGVWAVDRARRANHLLDLAIRRLIVFRTS